MTMDTEIEAKFYPVNKDTYRKRLRSIGAKLIIPERLMRRAIIDRRSHPEFVCDYIRVRDEGNLVRLSAKVHTDQTGSLGDQKEIDVVVSDFDRTLQLFESMGYKFDHFMETLRETWAYQGAEITIDTWPCLQPLSEIEAKSVNQVQTIAGKLGFDWRKKIITAAVEIIAEVYHLSIEETLAKVNHLTFNNNPFADLPKYGIINQQSV